MYSHLDVKPCDFEVLSDIQNVHEKLREKLRDEFVDSNFCEILKIDGAYDILKKYSFDGRIEGSMLNALSAAADELIEEKALETGRYMIDLIGDNYILDTIKCIYESDSEAGVLVGTGLADVLHTTKNKDVVIETAKTINLLSNHYGIPEARRIAVIMCAAPKYSGADNDALVKMNQTVQRYSFDYVIAEKYAVFLSRLPRNWTDDAGNKFSLCDFYLIDTGRKTSERLMEPEVASTIQDAYKLDKNTGRRLAYNTIYGICRNYVFRNGLGDELVSEIIKSTKLANKCVLN